jgi:hypothetical protein
MDEVAQTDFRTDAGARRMFPSFSANAGCKALIFSQEETAAGKHDGEIRGSASGGVPGQLTGGLADRSPAAEWPEGRQAKQVSLLGCTHIGYGPFNSVLPYCLEKRRIHSSHQPAVSLVALDVVSPRPAIGTFLKKEGCQSRNLSTGAPRACARSASRINGETWQATRWLSKFNGEHRGRREVQVYASEERT